MQPERLEKIDQLFQSALDLAPEQRPGFLDQGCASDQELRHEVESLLAAHAQAGNFIEDSASEVAAQFLAESSNEFSLVGRSIGQYKIVARIGAGGMGEVYLATDKMGRKVALKLLTARLINDEQGVARFMREAQAVLTLNHPNIVTVYDIGRADATHYIASELIEGQSLRERLKLQGEIKVAEALEIAIQISSALAAAHQTGIIHRDIKPENIMLRPDGYVKVVDFGIAKLMEGQKPTAVATDVTTKVMVKTAEGLAIGTVHYMSPEQARGLPVDVRTDTWSLGVIIYEMIAGRRPFDGETVADVLNSLIERQPPPLFRFSADVPETLEWIVNKALRKEKGERYQTAAELLTDLKELRRRLEFAAEQERTGSAERGGVSQVATKGERRTFGSAEPVADRTADSGPHTTSSAEYIVNEIKRHKRASLIAFMAILMVSAVGAYLYFSKTNDTTISSIAVLPFTNASADQNMEYLSDGLSENLINALSQLPILKVIARSSTFRYKGKEVDPQEVARALGVQTILTGRVEQRGENLVVSAELMDARDGTQVWGEQYSRKAGDIQALQEEMAHTISEKLRLRLTGAQERQLTKHATQSPQAYQLYMKGRYHALKLTRAETDKGINYFQQAIEIDPNYALAFVGLALAYLPMALTSGVPSWEVVPKAKAAALRAIEIDETLAEGHATLGSTSFWYDWDWQASEKQCLRALELNPNSAGGRFSYAHLLSNTGRHEQALAEIKLSRELDPLSLLTNALEGQILFFAGKYDEALDHLQKTIDLDPNFWLSHLVISRVYSEIGMHAEAIAAAKKAGELSGNSQSNAYRAYALAKAGKTDEARAVLDELLKLSAERYVPPYNFAIVYNALGESGKALDYLEKGYEQKDVRMVFLKVEPIWNSLRSEPRFLDLMKRMRLE